MFPDNSLNSLLHKAGRAVDELSVEVWQTWIEQQDARMIRQLGFLFGACDELVVCRNSE